VVTRPGPSLPRRGRRRDRLFQPEPFHPPFQATRRRHAQDFPGIRKNVANESKFVKEIVPPPLLPFLQTSVESWFSSGGGERNGNLLAPPSVDSVLPSVRRRVVDSLPLGLPEPSAGHQGPHPHAASETGPQGAAVSTSRR